MNTQTDHPEPGLREEMRAVEHEHPLHHWHLWLDNTGHVWAVCPHSEEGGSGTTLLGGTCEGADREIAVTEHEWARRAA